MAPGGLIVEEPRRHLHGTRHPAGAMGRSTAGTAVAHPDGSALPLGMKTTTRIVVLGVIPLLAVPGCVRDRNARETLGGVLVTGSLDGAEGAVAVGPSVGMDRAAWPVVVFEVPVDGTVHGPTHGGWVRFTDATARQRGLFPTIETALELDGDVGEPQALEGLWGPVAAGGEILWMPVGVVMGPPWAERQSPRGLYKRSRQGGWHSGVVESAGAPAAGALVEPAVEGPGS